MVWNFRADVFKINRDILCFSRESSFWYSVAVNTPLISWVLYMTQIAYRFTQVSSNLTSLFIRAHTSICSSKFTLCSTPEKWVVSLSVWIFYTGLLLHWSTWILCSSIHCIINISTNLRDLIVMLSFQMFNQPLSCIVVFLAYVLHRGWLETTLHTIWAIEAFRADFCTCFLDFKSLSAWYCVQFLGFLPWRKFNGLHNYIVDCSATDPPLSRYSFTYVLVRHQRI